MVVFICEICQVSFNRGKYRSHYCHSSKKLCSCVDCGERFEGNTSFEKHVTCISEQEKYTGKKDKKVDSWVTCLETALNSLDPFHNNLLQTIFDKFGHAAIPKKKQKFINFAKNMRNLTDKQVGTIWESIEQSLKAKSENDKKLAQEKKEAKLLKEQQQEKKSIDDDDDDDNIKQERKKLKKLIKKSDEAFLLLNSENKKGIKRLAKEFPETFLIVKDEEGRKRVQLLKKNEE